MSISCAGCDKTIEDDHVRIGAGIHNLCMECEGTEIEVFVVESDGSYFVTKSLAGILSLIEEMSVEDEPYSISKKPIPLAKYLTLPEFDGF